MNNNIAVTPIIVSTAYKWIDLGISKLNLSNKSDKAIWQYINNPSAIKTNGNMINAILVK